MTRNELHRIAGQMRSTLQKTEDREAWVPHTLPNGLSLILGRNAEQWTLALRRLEPRSPSTDEIFACGEAFGVPPDTDPRRYTRKLPVGDSDRQAVYNIVRLNWIEA